MMQTVRAIVFDIDWAPDYMIERCLNYCANVGIHASFYATHPTAILKEIAQDARFELGIHPNFLPGSSHGKTYSEVLRYCLDLAPDATSIRTHCLYQNSRMFNIMLEEFPQIRTDASLFLPNHPRLQAIDTVFGPGKILRRLPFFWEDDIAAGDPSFDWAAAPISTPGLNIFAFHPVHVALNTHRFSLYDDLAKIYPLSSWTEELVESSANKGAGTQTFINNLIGSFDSSTFLTITEMANFFK